MVLPPHIGFPAHHIRLPSPFLALISSSLFKILSIWFVLAFQFPTILISSIDLSNYCNLPPPPPPLNPRFTLKRAADTCTEASPLCRQVYRVCSFLLFAMKLSWRQRNKVTTRCHHPVVFTQSTVALFQFKFAGPFKSENRKQPSQQPLLETIDPVN